MPGIETIPPKIDPRMKQTFKKVAEGEKVSIAAKDSGYSFYYSRNPSRITKTLGWQYLLGTVDDRIILSRIVSILQGNDKKTALTAADMLLKLKDKYPANR